MSAEDLDNYETDAELALYREYRDVIKLFTYVVETERRFYLANKVDFNVRSAGQDVYFDVQLTDAWVWDVYRSSRFVKSVRIVTFKDVNVEEVQKTDIDIPDDIQLRCICPRQDNKRRQHKEPVCIARAHRGLCNIRKGIHSLNVRFRGLR